MKLQTARKKHKCDLCGGVIPKGVKYWNIYHPKFHYAHRHHISCEDGRRVTAAVSS